MNSAIGVNLHIRDDSGCSRQKFIPTLNWAVAMHIATLAKALPRATLSDWTELREENPSGHDHDRIACFGNRLTAMENDEHGGPR